MNKEPEWIEHDGSAVCPVHAGRDVEVVHNPPNNLHAYRDKSPEARNWKYVNAYRDWTAFEQQQASGEVPERLWLWRNHINGKPEYWAFTNAYPCHENGDPITLGHPIGWAIVKQSVNGRPDVSDGLVESLIAAHEPAPVDPIDALRDSIEALHGVSFDRDKMEQIIKRARVTVAKGVGE